MDTACPTTQAPSHSPSLSATRALAHLSRIRFLSAQEALQRLSSLAETGQILWLYRKYFPREYARSTASVQVPLSSDGGCGYSEREKEFLALVDRDLFPMPDLFFEDERFDMLPIYPQGVDWDEDLESLRLSLRAAMELIQGEDSPLWEQWLPAKLRPLEGPRRWRKFARLCRRAGGLKARLPLLIDLVSHNTGNLWLDITWESGLQDFGWNEKDLKLLRQEWRAAQRFLQKIDPLLDRMDKHPRYWLTELVKKWNAAIKTPLRLSATVRA